VVLGAWLELDLAWEGDLEIAVGGRKRRIPLDAWKDLRPEGLRPGEAVLAPPPRFRALPFAPGGAVRLAAGLEILHLRLGPAPVHPTVQ
jgi:hypothetical protein